jgi:hypothetical protein
MFSLTHDFAPLREYGYNWRPEWFRNIRDATSGLQKNNISEYARPPRAMATVNTIAEKYTRKHLLRLEDDLRLTPDEFLKHYWGTTEDFAVRRYCDLREAGFLDRDLLLWFTRSNITGNMCCVLLVKIPTVDGSIFKGIVDKTATTWGYEALESLHTGLFYGNLLGFGVGNPIKYKFKFSV